MAPVGETPTGDVAAGMGDEPAPSAAAAAAAKKGSYVPPALRAGGGAGERMGSKFGERDDFATLRVTNVCLSKFPLLFFGIFLLCSQVRTCLLTLHAIGLGDGRRRRAARYVRAVRQGHPRLPGQGQRHGSGEGFRVHQFRGSRGRCQGMQQDGRIRFQALDFESGVRQEDGLNGVSRCLGARGKAKRVTCGSGTWALVGKGYGFYMFTGYELRGDVMACVISKMVRVSPMSPR